MTMNADALSRLEGTLPTLRNAVEREHLGKALQATLDACRDLPQRIDRLKALGTSIGLLREYAGSRSDEIAAAVAAYGVSPSTARASSRSAPTGRPRSR